MAKLILVIDTLVKRGDGTPEDPHRFVRQLWSVDGELLMERDPAVVRPAAPTKQDTEDEHA